MDIANLTGTDLADFKAAMLAYGFPKTVTHTLTQSEILNAHTTPVTIIPAPGVGKMIMLLSVVSVVKFGTTPYTIPNDHELLYGADYASGHTHSFLYPSVDNPAFDNIFVVPSTQFSTMFSNVSLSIFENKPIVYSAPSTDPLTGGDGHAIITITYIEVPTA